MGALQDRVILNQKVFGTDIVDFFKKNCQFMVEKYSKSDDMCTAISKEQISPGRFYFFHYLDDSNWMKWAPVFVVDWKQLSATVEKDEETQRAKQSKEVKIATCMNFNFLPIEIRCQFFDKFITEEMFEKNSTLEVDFQGVYTELLNYGFEYCLTEFNVFQIQLVHAINLELLPRFLNSSHPKNTYDPKKLMEIRKSALKNREQRHKEMVSSTLKDFYDTSSLISGKYDALLAHIERLQKSIQKYGK
jgi:hypothetical protein